MRYRIGLLSLTAAAICGCDRKSQTVPPAPRPSAAVEQLIVHRPTTQELTGTPFKSLSLEDVGIPATIMVPTGWEFKKIGESADRKTLEGYAPSGLIVIAFPPTHNDGLDKKEALLEMTRADMAASPVTAGIPAVRQSGAATIVEDVELAYSFPTSGPTAATQPAMAATTTQSTAAPAADPVTRPFVEADHVEWTATIVMPYRGRFSIYQIRLVGFSRAQFDADHEFLQKVMGSLTFVPPPEDPK